MGAQGIGRPFGDIAHVPGLQGFLPFSTSVVLKRGTQLWTPLFWAEYPSWSLESTRLVSAMEKLFRFKLSF